MSGDTVRSDLEYGPSPSSRHSSLSYSLMCVEAASGQCIRFQTRVALLDQRSTVLQPPALSRCILPSCPSRRSPLKVSDEFPSPLFLVNAHSPCIKDDRFCGAQSPTIDQVMNNIPRRDTGLTGQTLYGDPSAKIWGLYLSQAEKYDKEHCESWTANTDGVLVFVRQAVRLYHP
jgi:hypothetical protein